MTSIQNLDRLWLERTAGWNSFLVTWVLPNATFDCVTSLVVFIVNPSYHFLQADKKALEETEAELKKEMTSLKERNHSLEQMLNELLSRGNGVLIYLFVCFG